MKSLALRLKSPVSAISISAGASSDVAARIMAEELSQTLGQRFFVENRPGAASNTAAAGVAKAEADGYTLFLGSAANVINTSLNTAGRPMVDAPRDALELFGSTPVDALVLGGHLVRRATLTAQGASS